MINCAVAIQISRNYSFACDTYAKNGVKSKVLFEVNELIYSYFDEKNEKFILIEHDRNGKISQIHVDTVVINKFASDLTNQINYKIDSIEYDFGIPIGNTLGLKYLSGKGPQIGVRIQQIGSVQFEIHSDIRSGGINQTLHRLMLTFTIEIDCLAPFYSNTIIIEPSVVLVETLIVGEVPEVLFPKG